MFMVVQTDRSEEDDRAADGDAIDEDEEHDGDEEEEIGDSEQRGTKRRVVRRRTRRVQSKLSGRNPPRGMSNSQQPASPDARETEDDDAAGDADQAVAENRDLKYLLAQLRACRGDPEKARSMLQYLSGCSFNAGETPDGIIRFSDAEAVQLSEYVAEVHRNQRVVAGLAEPRVRKIVMFLLNKLFESPRF